MEIKRPSHICAGAVFEFAAIFWNLFEKFLQKASFKHALALAFKGIAFCFRTYFCTASGYINSSCGTFTVFVIGTVVGFAVNLDGLTSTAVFGTVHGTLALFPEASAGCFIGTSGTVAHHINLPSGAEHIFVVSTGCCGTF